MTVVCDHCAAPLPWDGGVAYSELPFEIASACVGESGVVCDLCNDDFLAANNEENAPMVEDNSMWNEEAQVQDFDIDVPFFVKFDIDADGETVRQPTAQDVAAIYHGGCSSGAWMPAVTYYTAGRNIAENAREIEEYLDAAGIEIEKGAHDDIMMVAVRMVSTAVSVWAERVHEELVGLGYEEVR